KPDQLLEKRQTGQRWLAALKRENTVRVRVEEIRIHQAIERFQGHAPPGQRTVGIGLAVQVETVLAVQVADGRSGLDQKGRDARRRAEERSGVMQALTEDRELVHNKLTSSHLPANAAPWSQVHPLC